MSDDLAAGFVLPGPDPLDEGGTPHVAAAGLLTFHELALDHHLGRNPCVVHARLPEHVTAAHPLEAAEDVLQGVVERMADVERTRDVRRRDHHAVGLRPGTFRPTGLEGLRVRPHSADPRLDRGGLEHLVHETRR